MKKRMQSSYAMQKEFMKKWMKSLKLYTTLKGRSMSITERKIAIKLFTDVAIASTQTSSTGWSRAVISNASKKMDDAARIMSRTMSGQKVHSNTKLCRKILRKSHRIRIVTKKRAVKCSKAMKLVDSRIRLLKKLVPGGKQMVDEASLIREAMSYIASLRVQVDVMTSFASLFDF